MSAVAPLHSTLGVDISQNQRAVDFEGLHASGYNFAIIKATQGDTIVDTNFITNWNGAAKAGLIRGAYHVLTAPNRINTILAQAKHFVDTLEPYQAPGDMFPLLTLENPDQYKKFSKTAVSNMIVEFALAVELRLKTPVILQLPSTAEAFLKPNDALKSMPLWVVDHSLLKTKPKLPKSFSKWALWQYASNDASVRFPAFNSGGFNLFLGTLDQLKSALVTQ